MRDALPVNSPLEVLRPEKIRDGLELVLTTVGDYRPGNLGRNPPHARQGTFVGRLYVNPVASGGSDVLV